MASVANSSSAQHVPTADEAMDAINRILHQTDAGPRMVAQLPSLEGFPQYEGWGIIVSVEGIDFDYQFTRDDLRKVFQRYGRLSGVDTLSPMYPFGRVWFRSLSDAKVALADLDNKVLNGIHGRLRVSWDPQSAQKLHENNLSPRTGANQDQSPVPPASPPSVRKYTCRFDIGIENDKDFQVARRIIGQKGCNMKKIVDASGAKLRLRGKGSGYLEGPLKQESPEPLHLCVSCTTQKGYNEAVKAVTEILEGVYSDFAKFKRSRGSDHDREPLKVTVRETTLAGGTTTPEKDDFEYPSSPEPVVIPERRLDSGYWKVPS